MLTDYKNKALMPDTKRAGVCPSCKGNDWKKVVHGTRKFLVCKNCGHVKGINKSMFATEFQEANGDG